MTEIDAELLAALRAEVERQDGDRYPVQHATARFHLGATLLGGGRADEALQHLERARDLFPSDGLMVEHAKATNMVGIAQRDLGDLVAADEAFTAAAAGFAAAGNALEEAAARFNRGLVLRDAGQLEEALDAFRSSVTVFAEADARPQAAAAARELGASLLAAGQLDEAADVLRQAMVFARRGGDRAGLGVAANVLGIVALSADRPADAVTAFGDAAGAHPRAIRPAEHAMARSNLALACERAGRPDHARLAAALALAVPVMAPEVRAQAVAVLERVGEDPGALFRVLDDLERDERIGVLRAEFGRLASESSTIGAHVAAVTDGLAQRPDARDGLAEAWLEVLLEQPPELFDMVVAAMVAAVARHGAGDAVRAAVSRAMGDFHVPQWMRLKDGFNAAADASGSTGSWG